MKPQYTKNAEVYRISIPDFTGIVQVKSGYIVEIDDHWNRFHNYVFSTFLYWLLSMQEYETTIKRIQ